MLADEQTLARRRSGTFPVLYVKCFCGYSELPAPALPSASLPKSPKLHSPIAFRNLSCFFSTSILAVFSGGHGLASRSGREAIQNDVSATKVASRVRRSGFTLSNVSTTEWCV